MQTCDDMQFCKKSVHREIQTIIGKNKKVNTSIQWAIIVQNMQVFKVQTGTNERV